MDGVPSVPQVQPLSNWCEMQSENGTKDVARTMQLTKGGRVTEPLNGSSHRTPQVNIPQLPYSFCMKIA